MDNAIYLSKSYAYNDSWAIRGLYIFLIWVTIGLFGFCLYRYKTSYECNKYLPWTLHTFFIISSLYFLARILFYFDGVLHLDQILFTVLTIFPIALIFTAMVCLTLVWAHLRLEIRNSRRHSSIYFTRTRK